MANPDLYIKADNVSDLATNSWKKDTDYISYVNTGRGPQLWFNISKYVEDFENDEVTYDVINEATDAAGVTVDGVLLKDTTVDVDGTADAIILDADGDTTISSPTDDQIDFEVGGADDFRMKANKFEVLAGSEIDDRANFVIFDDFIQQTLTEADTPWVLNSGGDAQAVDPAINAQAGGVVRLTSGDADGTVANDGSQLVCHIPMRADSGGMVFETRLHINTAITDVSLFAGFTDSTSLEEAFTNSADTVTAVADDAVGFHYDTDATTEEWWALAVDGTTQDTGNAAVGTPPVGDDYQVLRIEVSSDGATCTFYIDGSQVAQLTGDAGVSPDVDLFATVIVNATTTTSKTVDVDYVYAKTNR